MVPNLARYVNKTILVSIPMLFDDTVCRPVRLLGAELNGLWLQSDQLTERLAPDEPLSATTVTTVFIPFAQMAGVLIHLTAPVQSTETQAPPGQSDAGAGDATSPQGSKRSKGKKAHGSATQN